MPKKNPKWDKQRLQAQYKKKMGESSSNEGHPVCQVEGCSKPKMRTVSMNNINEYLGKLGWKINNAKKLRKISLCKDHYREYSKLKKKEEKYKRMRDFESP